VGVSEDPRDEQEPTPELSDSIRDALLADTKDTTPAGITAQVIRTARKIVVAVVGFTVVAVGIAMVVLPGPAFIVIPAGLGILALEFSWARRWLRWARAQIESFQRLEERESSGAGGPPQADPGADTVQASPPSPPGPRPR